MKKSAVAAGVFALGYPLLVYCGLSPRWTALAAIGVLFLRWRTAGDERPRRLRRLAPAGFALAFIFAAEFWLNSGTLLLFVPALINLALLGAFAFTLLRPPSIAESFARLHLDDLTAEQTQYCSRVTLAWCLFFLLNAAFAAFTALFAPPSFWALYNGLLAYILIGLFFSVELTYRYWRFRVYSGAPFDALFRRIFPPLQG